MDRSRHRRRIRPAWWSLALCAVLVTIMLVCAGFFAGTFGDFVPVTLTSNRSGLVMESGAKVKLRGVEVGRVAGVEGGREPISVRLQIFPDQISHIPANVEAEIRSTTVFGAKYVDLIAPEHPSAERLAAGAVLVSRNVSTEVNTVFENLVDLLHHIDPAKLNAVLTAWADALRGRGQRLGEAITASNQVLQAVNPLMPAAQRDWQSLRGFAEAYADAAPNILAALEAASTTSTTITTHARDLDALLLSAIGFADAGINLLGATRDSFPDAVNVLEPTTALLSHYKPEYTCLLQGGNWLLDNGLREAFGGNGRSIVLDAGLFWAADQYRYPDNLPIVAAKGGADGKPSCGSLPDATKNWPVRQLVSNIGWGTGLDFRPNPGIAHPWWVNFLPVTRAVPEPPSIRGMGPPAIGPVPYPGAPPYGAAQYGPDGVPLYPPPPGAPPVVDGPTPLVPESPGPQPNP
ncbi:MAG TPA: MCE family protein [Mycobacterium sp.]|nr:MCE family protein [Mycobacterium sp.]